MKSKSVIITGGGVGKRMGAEIPKQFLILGDRPVLMHTIEKFYQYDNSIQIIIVLPQDQINNWKTLCAKYQFTIEHSCVAGGLERFHSVQNGLQEVTGDVVGVHDAVRPLVSIEVIANCFKEAEEKRAAIPVIELKQSLRKKEGSATESVDRSQYMLVQTPQCFSLTVLKEAYTQPFSELFTDDASVVEKLGVNISVVNGNEENIKITTPIDLKLTEFLVANG